MEHVAIETDEKRNVMNKRKKGFTLIEIIITIAILGIVVVLASTMMTFVYSNFNRQTVEVEATQTVRLALSTMSSAVKKGTLVTSSNSSRLEIDGVVYECKSNSLWVGAVEKFKGIESMKVTISGTKVEILLKSTPGKGGTKVEQDTVVYIR